MTNPDNPMISAYIHIDATTTMTISEKDTALFGSFHLLRIGKDIAVFLDPTALDRLRDLLNATEHTASDAA